MEKFNKHITENTIPLILYIISSFLVMFITNITYILTVLFLFLLISFILFNKKIVKKIIIISTIIISVVLSLSMLLSFSFSYKAILLNLPKSISFSIMITSTIAFFVYLPTIQLFYITRTIIKNEYPAYAILAGFRAFPVFYNFSKKIFVAIKIRKAYTSYLNLIQIYIQNIIVAFLNFLNDFIKKFDVVNIKETEIKLLINYKTYISILYFITLLIFIAYEK